jgi:hypothetical protein
MFFDIEQTCLAKNSKMFGHVVVRCSEPAGNFANAKRRFQQQTDNPYPSIFAKRFEGAHTVEAFKQQ